MKQSIAVMLLASALVCSAFAQTWAKVEKTDPLRGTQVVTYSLEGRFLTPPINSASGAHPTLIARCQPGDFAHHKAHGKMLTSYIFVGAILDSEAVSHDLSSRVAVEFRLDDGKLQKDLWSHSEDFSALFFNPYYPDGGFDNLIYGHGMPHKENTSPPIKKVVIGVPEYKGGEIVMQFDMPDPTDVADVCGQLLHK